MLITLPDIGQACSLAGVSLYEQFSTHSQVFLGTVWGRIKDAASGQGVYTISVDEAFKVLWDKDKNSSSMPFTVTYPAESPSADERVWRIEGTPACPDKRTQHCRLRSYGAEVDRWSGDVVRVFLAD